MHNTIDFESYSEANLKKIGAWKYWEHPSTEPICCVFEINDKYILWTFPGPLPVAVAEAIERGDAFDAHGAGFEQAAWAWCVRKLGWPPLPAERWDDTMARAAALSLPLGLDQVGSALGLEIQKDKVGKKWIQDYTRPVKATKKKPAYRRLDPDGLAVGYRYCEQDTKTEKYLRKKVGFLSARERSVWLMDQRINQRGIAVDIPTVLKAKEVVGQVETRLTKELQHVTKGEINSHGQTAVIKDWLAKRGTELEDLTADTVAEALGRKSLPDGVKRVLEIRSILAKASTKKLDAFLGATGSDGRVRYMFQYHGAHTGRWAGRIINVTNLPRAPKSLDGYDPDILAANIGSGDAGYLDMVYGDAMVAVATGLRTFLVADKGKKLVASDLKSIEAVGLAGLAGEESKLDVFRRGEDPYSVFATSALGFKVTKKTHPVERQDVGKPGELAFGYQGGVGAWRKFDDSDRFTDAEVQVFKQSWRDLHPNIVEMWGSLEYAALQAVQDKGSRHETNGIAFQMRGHYLVCTLPSGRNLSFPFAKVMEKPLPWSTPEKPAIGLVVTYMTLVKGKWLRVDTYGGKWAENVTQAACRDVLVVGMFGAEERGLPIVFHNYDEIVVEVDEKNCYAMQQLEEAMAERQAWYSNWPVSSEAWEGKRYRK